MLHDFFACLLPVVALFACVPFSRALLHGAGAARNGQIDGLRGYLAFFVFVSHAFVWREFLHSGRWLAPASPLYAHFGRSSVVLFFMVTGYLFFDRLLRARTPVDWLDLYFARVLRLTPMYLVAMLAMLGVVALASHGVRHESVASLLVEVVRWLTFTVTGAPDINGLARTPVITAGVTWSLPFEWLFYAALPALAVLLGVQRGFTGPLLGLAVAGSIAAFVLEPRFVLAFVPGLAAAVLARWPRFAQASATRFASLLVLGCLASGVMLSRGADEPLGLVLFGIAFAAIAAGNTLFGLLTLSSARALGVASYGLYLLHGIVLYVTFEWVIGAGTASRLGALEYWSVVLAITPLLVWLSALGFTCIEAPALARRAALVAWLRASRSRRSRRRPAPWP
jgi:peptidoglycan/LPS O-acetylase OafA/YrhL